LSRTRFVINFLALNKPWLHFVVCCYFFTLLFVWVGNPVLPIQTLARYGWAFFFLGMYLGSLGYLSTESFTYHDSFALFLIGVAGIVYAEIISYITMFPIVLTIVFIPSFLGYFVIRMHETTKSRKPSNNKWCACRQLTKLLFKRFFILALAGSLICFQLLVSFGL
jgi:hypothetical protein